MEEVQFRSGPIMFRINILTSEKINKQRKAELLVFPLMLMTSPQLSNQSFSPRGFHWSGNELSYRCENTFVVRTENSLNSYKGSHSVLSIRKHVVQHFSVIGLSHVCSVVTTWKHSKLQLNFNIQGKKEDKRLHEGKQTPSADSKEILLFEVAFQQIHFSLVQSFTLVEVIESCDLVPLCVVSRQTDL